MMYERIKSLFDSARNRYILIGSIVFLALLCAGYILYQPSRTDYHRAVDAVERAQEQQRESLELNRSIQRSIDRSTEVSNEAKERIDRSTQYNQQIGERIDASQASINEARNYLKRNAELFDRIERSNRERQENNQEITDATNCITSVKWWRNYWGSVQTLRK